MVARTRAACTSSTARSTASCTVISFAVMAIFAFPDSTGTFVSRGTTHVTIQGKPHFFYGLTDEIFGKSHFLRVRTHVPSLTAAIIMTTTTTTIAVVLSAFRSRRFWSILVVVVMSTNGPEGESAETAPSDNARRGTVISRAVRRRRRFVLPETTLGTAAADAVVATVAFLLVLVAGQRDTQFVLLSVLEQVRRVHFEDQHYGEFRLKIQNVVSNRFYPDKGEIPNYL